MKIQLAAILALMMSGSIASASPTISANVISWPDDGYYQVQRSGPYGHYNIDRCEGSRTCAVSPGTYSVIRLAPGPVKRFDGLSVDSTDITVTGNRISWADDSWYQVQRIDENRIFSINRCEGKLYGCTVGPGKYSVIRLAPAPVKRYDGYVVSRFPINVRMNEISWPNNGLYQVQDAQTNLIVCSGGQSCVVEPGNYNVTNTTDDVTYKDINVTGPSVFSDALGSVPIATLENFFESASINNYEILTGAYEIDSSISCPAGGSLTLNSRGHVPSSLYEWSGYAFLTANACADEYSEFTGKLYISVLESETEEGTINEMYTLSDGYILNNETNEFLRFDQMLDGSPSVYISKILASENLESTQLFRDYRLSDVQVLNMDTGPHTIGHLNYRTAAVRLVHGEYRTQFTMTDAVRGYTSYPRTSMEATYNIGMYGGNTSITSIDLQVRLPDGTATINSSSPIDAIDYAQPDGTIQTVRLLQLPMLSDDAVGLSGGRR